MVLQDEGFVENQYDSCVMNKQIAGSQCTICWHVDDLKISHRDPGVVDEILITLTSIYGPLSVERGREHTYLGIDLDYRVAGEVTVSMIPYLQEIVDEFPEELTGKVAKTPAANRLFDVNPEPEFLNRKRGDIFHRTVAKLLWASLRARPDILLAISFLTSRVKQPDKDDWEKLTRLVVYLKESIDLRLRLSSSVMGVVKWWVDASFATRDQRRSQTGGCLSMGNGAVFSFSKKQKLVTKSSTEAELVGVDDVLPQVIWTRNFLLGQGWTVSKNLVYQDNKSAILLETNGVASSSRRTRHIDIRFYFVKDRIAAGELSLEFCPTDEMWADYFTKPLQGAKFLFLRRIIMNEPGVRSVLNPEELEELEEWVREQDESDGLDGEPVVWGPGTKVEDKERKGGSYLDALD